MKKITFLPHSMTCCPSVPSSARTACGLCSVDSELLLFFCWHVWALCFCQADASDAKTFPAASLVRIPLQCAVGWWGAVGSVGRERGGAGWSGGGVYLGAVSLCLSIVFVGWPVVCVNILPFHVFLPLQHFILLFSFFVDLTNPQDFSWACLEPINTQRCNLQRLQSSCC